MRRLGIIGLLIVTTNLSGQPITNTFYVSPSGDDANEGSLYSPFQTLARAFTQLTNNARLVIYGNHTNAVGGFLMQNCTNVELVGVEGATLAFTGYGDGIRVEQFENLQFVGLTFVGDRPALWSQSPDTLGVVGAIALAGTNNSGLTIRDCRFLDWPDQAITGWVGSLVGHGHTTDNVWVQNNVFQNIGTTNFPAGAWTSGDGACLSTFFRNHVWVQNNYVTNCLKFFEFEPAGDGRMANTVAEDWHITDNVLVDHMGWLVFAHNYYGISSRDIWIERNSLKQSTWCEQMINLRTSTNVFIRSNTFVSVSDAIHLEAGSDNIVIEGNTFDGGYHSVLCGNFVASEDVPCWNLTIKANTFQLVHNALILGAVNQIVESNTFAGLPGGEPICVSVLNGGHAYGPDWRGWATNLTFANNILLPPFNPDSQFWLFTAGSNRLERFTFAGNLDNCSTPVTSMFLDPPWTYARSNMFIDQPEGSTGILHGNLKAAAGSRWVVEGVCYVNTGDANWEAEATEPTQPFILTEPSSQSQVPGLSATFNVNAGGAAPLSYQWQFNESDIPGATAPSLTVTNVQSTDLGIYRVRISNGFGSIVSSDATLESGQIAIWPSSSYAGSNVMTVPTAASNVVAVAAGVDFNLALKADGTVQGWSGPELKAEMTIPESLVDVVSIAGGNKTSLALRSDGTVIAWGDNTYGQTDVPEGLTGVVAIAVGDYHCLALQSDGIVAAWGSDFAGEANVPAQLTNVVAIAAGSRFSLALKPDGTITSWGDELSSPPGLTGVVAIAAGGEQALALLGDGTLMAWGQDGQLNVPAGLSNVVAVAAGSYDCVALLGNGTLVEWATNGISRANTPAGLTNVVAIAAGADHHLALIGTGPPVLQAQVCQASWSENAFRVSLPSQSGRVYALEYKDSLNEENWVALPLVAGDGGNLILTDSTATTPGRFYRVRRW